MTVSSTVLDALRNALEAAPEDHEVRLHLAQMLLQAGEHAEALKHFTHLLASDPASIKALQGASEAAREIGESQKAQGYETLLKALQGESSEKESDQDSVEEETLQDENIVQLSSAQPGSTQQSSTKHSDKGESEQPARLRVVENESNVEIGPWDDPEPRITLDDVGGMEAVKKRLNMSFLAPLKNPDMMKMYGKSLRGGLMLYGPPGCGKTFIARALAGELGAKFMSVGMSDVLDMWMGESERKLHEIFETARRNAPTVLFFDEIDALGQKRSQLRNSGGRNIVNQLLAEMDSIGGDNKNVFILGATNHPWDVDTALRRPGRFDRVVLVLPPDQAARETILDLNLKERPVEGIELERIAAQTDFYSGADLAHVCETATEHALHEALNSGDMRPVKQKDFDAALKEVRPSTRPWFDTARNYAMFANEGGVYDDLLNYIQEKKL